MKCPSGQVEKKIEISNLSIVDDDDDDSEEKKGSDRNYLEKIKIIRFETECEFQ